MQFRFFIHRCSKRIHYIIFTLKTLPLLEKSIKRAPLSQKLSHRRFPIPLNLTYLNSPQLPTESHKSPIPTYLLKWVFRFSISSVFGSNFPMATSIFDNVFAFFDFLSALSAFSAFNCDTLLPAERNMLTDFSMKNVDDGFAFAWLSIFSFVRLFFICNLITNIMFGEFFWNNIMLKYKKELLFVDVLRYFSINWHIRFLLYLFSFEFNTPSHQIKIDWTFGVSFGKTLNASIRMVRLMKTLGKIVTGNEWLMIICLWILLITSIESVDFFRLLQIRACVQCHLQINRLYN